jgi:hypothetical protein
MGFMVWKLKNQGKPNYYATKLSTYRNSRIEKEFPFLANQHYWIGHWPCCINYYLPVGL